MLLLQYEQNVLQCRYQPSAGGSRYLCLSCDSRPWRPGPVNLAVAKKKKKETFGKRFPLSSETSGKHLTDIHVIAWSLMEQRDGLAFGDGE